MTGTRTIYRPYFKGIDRKLALIREARSWLRTPFRAHCAMKGIGADCVGFAHAVYVALGAVQPIKFPDYALDEGSHSNESKLVRVLNETDLFTEIWHHAGGEEIPPLTHGDLLCFHLGRSVHHCGILLGAPHFVHAIQNYGVIESMITDPTYRRVMVSVWRCMEPLERYDDFTRAGVASTVHSRSPEAHP
jgi:cell wall-associated NlpC family hydrolase